MLVESMVGPVGVTGSPDFDTPMATDNAPADFPALALSCVNCVNRSISSRPTMSSNVSRICSLRDFNAHKLLVAKVAACSPKAGVLLRPPSGDC